MITAHRKHIDAKIQETFGGIRSVVMDTTDYPLAQTNITLLSETV